MLRQFHHLLLHPRTAFLAALLTVSAISSAEVTYFKSPPTPQELQKILRSGNKPAGTGTSRGLSVRGIELNNNGRGIEWNSNLGTSHQDPVRPEPVSVAATPVARPAPSGSTEASEKNAPAIAIPVNFNLGSSDIKSTSMPYIDAIAALLIQDPSVQLTVEGHTDASGDPRRNLMLSWERAFTVFRVLVTRYNIDPSRLKPIGKGASEPITGAAPAEDINRRVQFRVLG